MTGLRLEPASGRLELTAGEPAPAAAPTCSRRAVPLSGRCAGAAVRAAPTVTLTVRSADGRTGSRSPRGAASRTGRVRTQLWARGALRDLEDRYAARARRRPRSSEQIDATSLRFGVLCRFTAFVAVDRSRPADGGGHPRRVVQPVELPAGWGRAAAPAPYASAPGAAAPGGSGRPAAKQARRLRRGPMTASAGAHQAPPAPSGPARAALNQEPGDETSWDKGALDGAAYQALAAYAARAEELFTRIEHCLAKNADRTALYASVYELADDLASVGSHKPLVKALRELAGALRHSPNPRSELAAARKAFADAVVSPPPPGKAGRGKWWRAPGS